MQACVRSRIAASLCVFLLALPMLPATAAAQTTLAEYQLAGPLGEVGGNVADAGDVNGDGIHDLLIGGTSPNSVTGILLTYSGADSSLLPGSFAVSGGIGTGDLNGDGQRDVLSVSLLALTAFSRATGLALWSVSNLSPTNSGGRNASVVPDVDGDGVDDVLFGEPVAFVNPGGGIVRLLSGANGALIHQFIAPAGSDTFGLATAPFADADGDGVGDLLIGQSGYYVAAQKLGRVRVYSSITYAVLQEIPGDGTVDGFGGIVLDAGDLDGDGVHEIVTRGFEVSTSRVYAFSGATLEQLWARGGLPAGSLISVGDVNGDGITDLVAAQQGGVSVGSASVVSGADGAVLNTIPGSATLAYSSIAGPGDLDGDGIPEWLVGVSSNSFVAGSSPHAEIRALPGGVLLSTISNPASKMNLGLDVTLAGDLDGDGLSDVGTIGDAHVAVFSQATGAPLFVTKLPVVPFSTSDGTASSITAPGDLDGDGVPDLVVGDGNVLNVVKGRVFVVSGANGALLSQLEGVQGQENLGLTVAATDDRNGDGVRDVWVTANILTVNGKAAAGEVRLYSGANWSVLMTLHGAIQSNGNFGESLSVGGDLDGDGVPDIAVGSGEDIAGPNSGALYVISGASGAVLRRIDGAFLSNDVTGIITGDVDGDDVPDVLAAEVCWNACQGRVRLFSGRTGAQLWEVHGLSPNGNMGQRLSRAGDVNGDGRADVAVAEYSATFQPVLRLLSGLDGSTLDVISSEASAITQIGSASAGLFDAGGCSDVLVGQPLHNGNGSVRVLASSQGGVHGFIDVGFGKVGSNGKTPTLRGYGDLAPGGLVTVTARRALPAAPSVWFVGMSAGYVPFKQGTLVPDPFGFFLVFPIVTDANGVFSITAPNPSSVFTGLALWHQFWFKDAAAAGGVSATNGMEEIFK